MQSLSVVCVERALKTCIACRVGLVGSSLYILRRKLAASDATRR